MAAKGTHKPILAEQRTLFRSKGLKHIGFSENRRYGRFRFLSCQHEQEVHLSQLNDTYRIKCNICEKSRLDSEAKKAGFKIIGDVIDGPTMGSRRYECLHCGHRSDFSLRNMRRSLPKGRPNYRCGGCSALRWEQEARAASMVLLGEPENGKKGYMRYGFKGCSHEGDYQRTHVAGDCASCVVCVYQIRKREAQKTGLTLLNRGTKKSHGHYVFNECGHQQQILYGKVREQKNYHCRECLRLKHVKEATDAGVVLLGSAEARSNQYRSYRFKCGHIRDATTAQVRQKHILCNECEDTYLKKPSEIYVLRIMTSGQTFLKLGISSNLFYRVQTYGLPVGSLVFKVASRAFPTGKASTLLEKKFHTKHKNKKLPKEQMKQFFAISGYTECYPTDFSQTIINELGLTKYKRSKLLTTI